MAAVPPVQTATGAAVRSHAVAVVLVPEAFPVVSLLGASPAVIRLRAFPVAIPPEAFPVAIPPAASLVAVSQVVTVAVSRAAMVEGGTVDNSVSINQKEDHPILFFCLVVDRGYETV